MEAAAEGAVGLSEARDGSPLSVAAASDDGDTVVGVSYGMDAADMGMVPVICSQKNPTRSSVSVSPPTYPSCPFLML